MAKPTIEQRVSEIRPFLSDKNFSLDEKGAMVESIVKQSIKDDRARLEETNPTFTEAANAIWDCKNRVGEMLNNAARKITELQRLNKRFPGVQAEGAAEFSWDWIKTNEAVIAALDAEDIEAEDLRGLISLCVYHSMKVLSESNR